MLEARMMIADERTLLLFGDPGFPKFTEQLAACITGQWTLDVNSTATGVYNGDGIFVVNTQSQVAAQTIPMKFDADQLLYSGNGPLAYDSYSISVNWVVSGDQDCSSGSGNPGVLGAGAEFDLNLFPMSPNQVRLELALTPEITENTILGWIDPDTGQCEQSTNTTTYYEEDLVASHSAPLTTITFYYYVNLNTPITYNLTGTSNYAEGVTYQGTEQTTLTASQTQ
jgi:hypothetical protein